MIELMTRFIAARRERRWDSIRVRRAANLAAEQKRKEELDAYERAHAAERLGLAQSVLERGLEFATSEKGQWACARYGRWPLVSWLEVDARGRIWIRESRHWFGSTPAKLMETPEELAANFTVATLRGSLRMLEAKRFWFEALEEEVLHHLGFRGRPV